MHEGMKKCSLFYILKEGYATWSVQVRNQVSHQCYVGASPSGRSWSSKSLRGLPVEAGHVCGSRSYIYMYICVSIRGAAWSIGGIGSGILDLHQATHIYDMCGGMISYMYVMFYIQCHDTCLWLYILEMF